MDGRLMTWRWCSVGSRCQWTLALKVRELSGQRCEILPNIKHVKILRSRSSLTGNSPILSPDWLAGRPTVKSMLWFSRTLFILSNFAMFKPRCVGTINRSCSSADHISTQFSWIFWQFAPLEYWISAVEKTRPVWNDCMKRKFLPYKSVSKT